jgi:hypothetical protein
MRWLVVAALALLIGIAVKGQLDFNKLMATAKKSAGSL